MSKSIAVNDKARGGKRPGAGRPKEPDRPPAMSWRPASHEQAQKFRLLGGAKWLRQKLDEENLPRISSSVASKPSPELN